MKIRRHIPFLRFTGLALALVVTSHPVSSARADDLSPKSDAPAKSDDVALKFDEQWGFNLHTEYPGAAGSLDAAPDGKSVKLKYDFSNGGSFVSAGTKLTNTGTYPIIEVKAKGLGGLGVSVVDSTGQVFVYHLGSPGVDEQTYKVSLDTPSNSYGGAKDKTVHYPLQALDVLVSKIPDPLSGTIEVTGVTLKGSK